MTEAYSRTEFFSLPKEKIAELIENTGKPRVVVFVPDGTRRIGVICYGLSQDSNDFENQLFEKISEDLMKVEQLFFDHGLHTLIVPCISYGNLERKNNYIEKAINHGLKRILHDEEWLKFYDDNKIKVKIYGDYDTFSRSGYGIVSEWIDDVQFRTRKHDRHVLYYGLVCSGRGEYDRLIDHAVAFYQEHGRRPSREEQLEWYFNGKVEDVDLFIRTSAIRDSDLQPHFISGVKTQMYFTFAPFPFMNSNTLREILYDYLYSRPLSYGTDTEASRIINGSEAELVKNYYVNNSDAVVGIGKRIGDFWLPMVNLKSPDSEEK